MYRSLRLCKSVPTVAGTIRKKVLERGVLETLKGDVSGMEVWKEVAQPTVNR